MNKNKFFVNAIVVMVLLIAVLRLMDESVVLVPKEQLKEETSAAALDAAKKEFPQSVTPISAFQVSQKLATPQTPVTLLYIYTSWCGYCMRQTPIIEKLLDEYKRDRLTLLAVSLDDAALPFAKHLEQFPPSSSRFGNNLLIPQDRKKLVQALRATGANFRSSFPFLAVYNAQGKLIGGGDPGYMPYDQLKSLLEAAFAPQ